MATVRVQYGGRNGAAYELETTNDLVAVRTRDAGPIEEANLSGIGRRALDLVEPVVQFRDAGVQVFHVRSGGEADRDTVRTVWKAEPEVRFAGRVLADPVYDPTRVVPASVPAAAAAKSPVLYSENLFVTFGPKVKGAVARKILDGYGLKLKREVAYLRNAYFVEAPEGIGLEVFDLALRMLGEKDAIELCHPEVLRPRVFRAAAPQQWHLHRTPVGSALVDAHARVVNAWSTTRGEGTTIAVIDTGIDIDHREFASAGKVVAPFNATADFGSADDPRPRALSERHGTACAGVACANGLVGASGVAPGAKLMPIRLMSGLGSQDEGDAIAWAADHGADVISCSWGPPDGRWNDPLDPTHRARVPMPDSTRLAVEHALAAGRGGKGCVICFAAGNGNESVDNDGYASHPGIIAVAACNDRSQRSVYSDTGKALVCAFPSNDFPFAGVAQLPVPPPDGGVWVGAHPGPLTPGIWTTDRSGSPGYNRGGTSVAGDPAGHFTNSFGGTSSACPGVAGVAALVLSVDPMLTHEQVKDLFKRACDRIDVANGRYDPVTGHSLLYGFGRLNASTAVGLAGQGGSPGPSTPAAAPPAGPLTAAAVAPEAFRATAGGGKLTFTIGGATIAWVFVRAKNTAQGVYVALSIKGGKHTGSISVGSGAQEFLLTLQGGQPLGDYSFTVQLDEKKPLDLSGKLDVAGNGGRVGSLSIL